MQIVDAEIQLSGSIKNTVMRTGVTPAEIVLLRHIHGHESVVNVRPRKNDKRPHEGEVDRLKARYGSAKFSEVFTGFVPKLPVYLKDIGLEDAFYARDAVPSKKSKEADQADQADAPDEPAESIAE